MDAAERRRKDRARVEGAIVDAALEVVRSYRANPAGILPGDPLDIGIGHLEDAVLGWQQVVDAG